jgi:hypothetical protein
MKRIVTLTLGLVLCATMAFSQAKIDGTFQIGSFAEKGGPQKLAWFVGGDVPLYTDTVKGFQALTRAGYFHAYDPYGDQALAVWTLARKSLGLSKNVDFYITFGGGMINYIKDSSDVTQALIKLETSFRLWKFINTGIGADYMPAAGGGDKTFLYVLVDLLPPL